MTYEGASMYGRDVLGERRPSAGVELTSPGDVLKMRAGLVAGQPPTAEQVDRLLGSYLSALELLAGYAELERQWDERAGRLSEFSERGANLRGCAAELRAVSRGA